MSIFHCPACGGRKKLRLVILEVLTTQNGMSVDQIIRKIHSLGQQRPARQSVINDILELHQEGSIVRVARGEYALPPKETPASPATDA